jgi:hypothetical protein
MADSTLNVLAEVISQTGLIDREEASDEPTQLKCFGG